MTSVGNATTFTFDAAQVVFGAGASDETGDHLRRLGREEPDGH